MSATNYSDADDDEMLLVLLGSMSSLPTLRGPVHLRKTREKVSCCHQYELNRVCNTLYPSIRVRTLDLF